MENTNEIIFTKEQIIKSQKYANRRDALNVVLPDKYYFGIMQYERYIQLGLMICLYIGLLNRPLRFLVNLLADGIFWLVGLLPLI